MAKQKTSFSLSPEALSQLAEVSGFYKRSMASTLEVLIENAHTQMEVDRHRIAAGLKRKMRDDDEMLKNL